MFSNRKQNFHYTLESKDQSIQWHHIRSSSGKKFKGKKSVRKIIASVF